LIDRRRHPNVLDDRSFRGADWDNDHYMVVAKVWERLAVSKKQSTGFIWRGSISRNLTRWTVKSSIYLLTYGAEPFLKSCQFCSHSGTSQHFKEPEGSSLFTTALHLSLFWPRSI
jgi:hypothetical protein